MQDDQANDESRDDGEGAEQARRDALKRLGLLGLSTAPAMMLLFSSKASAAAITTSINTSTGST